MESKFIGGNLPENSSGSGKKSDRITTLIFFISILVFFTGFNFSDNPPSGWYLQTMPDLGNSSISDIAFLDSLNGFAVSKTSNINDTAFILKTTNGGDNWVIKYRSVDSYSKVMFADNNLGYVSGGDLLKSTNGGNNWQSINRPNQTNIEDMYVLNKDTIWILDSDALVGGVYRTTNGGINWTQQLSAGNQNPDKIYMYNARIGFIVRNNSGAINLRKTTDGGNSWFTVVTGEGFNDIYFNDSLVGWRAWSVDSIKKSTDGGLTWFKLLLPTSNSINGQSSISKFSFINKDTIWGIGAIKYNIPTPPEARGLIYISTNGGNSWGYQLPDPNIVNIWLYYHIKFANKNLGWAYYLNKGVHTVTGGDSTIYVGIKNINTEIPSDYSLSQNYPNPFNQSTIFNFQCSISGHIIIKVYDISGKELMILVNERKPAGKYEVRFDAGVLSSGIYFYSLTADGKTIETKKAVLIK